MPANHHVEDVILVGKVEMCTPISSPHRGSGESHVSHVIYYVHIDVVNDIGDVKITAITARVSHVSHDVALSKSDLRSDRDVVIRTSPPQRLRSSQRRL
jgi:hypothetical protein